MGMLFVFTGLGLLLFIGAVAALIWSIRTGQLDDLETPALRVLNDDATPGAPSSLHRSDQHPAAVPSEPQKSQTP